MRTTRPPPQWILTRQRHHQGRTATRAAVCRATGPSAQKRAESKRKEKKEKKGKREKREKREKGKKDISKKGTDITNNSPPPSVGNTCSVYGQENPSRSRPYFIYFGAVPTARHYRSIPILTRLAACLSACLSVYPPSLPVCHSYDSQSPARPSSQSSHPIPARPGMRTTSHHRPPLLFISSRRLRYYQLQQTAGSRQAASSRPTDIHTDTDVQSGIRQSQPPTSSGWYILGVWRL